MATQKAKPAADTTRGSPVALNTSGLYTNKLNDITDSNALGYVNAVKSAKLCGLTNWRLPTKEELLGIVDRTVASGATVDANWFPNTQTYDYWTSSPQNSDYAWGVNFIYGIESSGARSNYFSRVRLVHD